MDYTKKKNVFTDSTFIACAQSVKGIMKRFIMTKIRLKYDFFSGIYQF